jgi:ParB-like chromosome segregation protein Spo0J|tara:strand:+ start:92 stop:763 length:672 start_codon:yes stop_codon:yes gene_type:complete
MSMTIIDLEQINKLEGQARFEAIEKARQALAELSPLHEQPVDRIRWVPVEDVEPNDYNPNSVAKIEMGLLYTSILHDGYTQPVVTIWDEEKQKYVIVDGFHRYFTCRNNPDIRERNLGYLPIVVLDKPINDRMASTVRHNRARGKHSIDGMSNMVFQMSENGWSEAEICGELGMEAEEVLRLKHITGFSKLFENAEYKKAWESKVQLKLRKQAEKQAAAESAD